jgi:hypothetical protein
VLLARDAPLGLVIRRGPTKAVCTLGWDRQRDTFTVGQWLKGRIYELRCDLSPDGAHAIYFAMNGHWGSRAKGAWTAISRAPYLHAVTLWAKGDCWHGGGLFVDDRTYWLNNGYGHTLLDDTGEVTRAERPPFAPRFGGECWGVYFERLLRDGWTMHPELQFDFSMDALVGWDKPLWHGWTLRKLARAQVGAPPGKGVYYDEHELIGPREGGRGRELMRHTWEWADVDRNRLVWAEAGKLYAARITKASATREDPLDDVRELYDFNPLTFEAIRAPYAGAAKPVPTGAPEEPRPASKSKSKSTRKRKRSR